MVGSIYFGQAYFADGYPTPSSTRGSVTGADSAYTLTTAGDSATYGVSSGDAATQTVTSADTLP